MTHPAPTTEHQGHMRNHQAALDHAQGTRLIPLVTIHHFYIPLRTDTAARPQPHPLPTPLVYRVLHVEGSVGSASSPVVVRRELRVGTMRGAPKWVGVGSCRCGLPAMHASNGRSGRLPFIWSSGACEGHVRSRLVGGKAKGGLRVYLGRPFWGR